MFRRQAMPNAVYPAAVILSVSAHPRQLQLTLTLNIDVIVLQAIMFDRAIIALLQCTERDLTDALAAEPAGFSRVVSETLEGISCTVQLQPRQHSAGKQGRVHEKDPKVISLVPHEALPSWRHLASAL